jgi:hypothetical protein
MALSLLMNSVPLSVHNTSVIPTYDIYLIRALQKAFALLSGLANISVYLVNALIKTKAYSFPLLSFSSFKVST